MGEEGDMIKVSSIVFKTCSVFMKVLTIFGALQSSLSGEVGSGEMDSIN